MYGYTTANIVFFSSFRHHDPYPLYEHLLDRNKKHNRCFMSVQNLDLNETEVLASAAIGGPLMVGKLSAVLFASAAFLTLAGMALAQERIRIAWAGASPANSAIWVIQEKKLLQKQGVEPEIISISASPTVLQALLAGEIDVTATSVATLVTSRLANRVMVSDLPKSTNFDISAYAPTSPSACTRTALSRDGPRQRRAQGIS